MNTSPKVDPAIGIVLPVTWSESTPAHTATVSSVTSDAATS
jgi:hypothetical protein